MNVVSKRINQQVNLDRETGGRSIKLRAILISMDESFERVQIYRAAAITACAIPPACAEATDIFKTALQAESQIEGVLRSVWKTEELSWRASTTHNAFPKFPYAVINPSDLWIALDQAKQKSTLAPGTQLNLRATRDALASTARIERSTQNEWKVKWIE